MQIRYIFLGILLITVAFMAIASAAQALQIWGIPQSFRAGGITSVQMLDVFSNHVVINSNQTISVVVQSIWSSVPIANFTGKHIDFYWNMSEGCNAYEGIIFQPQGKSFTIYPQVTATYAPAPTLTGICNTTAGEQQLNAYYAGIAQQDPLVQEGILNKGGSYTGLVVLGRMLALGWMNESV